MPITEDQADREIDAFYKEYKGVAALKIIHRPTQEDFYGQQASIEAVGAIQGAFLPRRREVHLPLANFRDTEDLRTSLRHEALGHYATLTFSEPAKRRLLDVISDARQSPSMANDWSKVDRAYGDHPESLKAEEVYCLIAERVADKPKTAAAQAEKVWADVVTNKLRPMEREDLQTIVDHVAHGIRHDVRPQQIFPTDDRSQFRTEPGATAREDQAQTETLAAPGHSDAFVAKAVRKMAADGLNGAQRLAVVARLRENAAQAIEVRRQAETSRPDHERGPER